jgi:phosphoesterase RecJ-like protein
LNSLDRACEVISQASSIVLTTHRHPDGDGIGSQLGLLHTLAADGKRVYAHNRDGVPRIYRFLDGSDLVSHGEVFEHGGDVDLIIGLDCGNKQRLGLPDDFFAHAPLLNIDHHHGNTMYGDDNLVTQASATGEIIYELLLQLGLGLTVSAANALYAAILTDTSSFRLANSTASIHRITAELIEAGAEPWVVGMHVYENYPRTRLDLLSLCLGTLEVCDGGRSAWLFVDEGMLAKTGASLEETEGFIDFARSVEGADVSVFVRYAGPNSWRVSFRSKTVIDVSQTASRLGGGGHRYAAACVVHGSLLEVRSQVGEAVSNILDNASHA